MSWQAKGKPANLTLNLKTDRLKAADENSPPTATSPMNLEGIDLSSFGGDFNNGMMNLPPLPQSPPASPHLNKDPSKTFMTNIKTRVAAEQEQRAEPPQRRLAKDDDEYRPGSSSVSKIYHLRKHPGSTPELSLVGSAENVRKHSGHSDDAALHSQMPEKPSSSPQPIEDVTSSKRKEKGFRNPLSRSKSIRRDSSSKSKSNKPSLDHPPKTAPLVLEGQGPSDMLLKAKHLQKRGKSAERAIASESDENLAQDKHHGKEHYRGAFVSGSKNVMNKAKTGGGNLLNRLGKIGRTNSTQEKEIPDSEYVIKVINMPLVEQTRITRISKDLGSCRDKTEYWMPSLPWRCIDYLNLNCESEGLYRIPGSGPQVKHWQRRFDTELDVDLLDEQDLYDPNIISSMLKSWLRDLPTEIMPKAKQQALADDIAKDNPDYQKMGQPAPQKLRDALSELSPFNYYLLFAITCHLSLLLSHKDKNKMDLNNLSICIGPPLDLDRWLFNYLVGDWRHCWQGCYTEKQYLEGEKAYEAGLEYGIPDTEKSGSRDQSVERSKSNASQYDDEKSAKKDLLPPSQNEKLDAYPDYSQYLNGVLGSPEHKPFSLSLVEPNRPATALAEEVIANKKTMLSPKPQAHSRSQSDLPLTPIKGTSPLDLEFKE